MFKNAVNLQWPEHLRIDEHLLQDLPDCLWLEGCEREVETYPWAPRLQQRDSWGGYEGTFEESRPQKSNNSEHMNTLLIREE